MNIMSIDVEEWFHILDCSATPDITSWARLEPRLERNLETLLTLLDETDTRATFFWLGWVAERYKKLLRRCRDAGHEIGSHGYAHISCARLGRRLFSADIVRSRHVLEDILSEPVTCFRAPGFAMDGCIDWCFDAIRSAGYTCDSSVPTVSMIHLSKYLQSVDADVLATLAGPLTEVPISSFDFAGRKVWTFGGGYFRVTPWRILQRVSEQIRQKGKPLVVYIHPRDIDAESPCLRLGPWRRFKFVVNRRATIEKLRALLTTYEFCSISDSHAPVEPPASRTSHERVDSPRASVVT